MTWLPATEPLGMRLLEWGAIRFGIASGIGIIAETGVKSNIWRQPISSDSVGLVTVGSRCVQIGLAIASIAPILFKNAPPPTSFGLIGLCIAYTPIFMTIIFSQSSSWTKHFHKPASVFCRLLVLVARIVTVATTTIAIITAFPPGLPPKAEQDFAGAVLAGLILVFLILPYTTQPNPNAEEWALLV